VANGAGTISRAPRPSSLADVLDLILDKGLVIDAYVRVSLAGIELLTIDARIVVASVDTYLRFAEAVNRLDLTQTEKPGLRAFMGDGDEGGESDDRNGKSKQNGSSSRSERSSTPALSSPKEISKERRPSERAGQSRDRRPAGERDRSGDGDGLLGRLVERARFD
jgi:hypothetical protein